MFEETHLGQQNDGHIITRANAALQSLITRLGAAGMLCPTIVNKAETDPETEEWAHAESTDSQDSTSLFSYALNTDMHENRSFEAQSRTSPWSDYPCIDYSRRLSLMRLGQQVGLTPLQISTHEACHILGTPDVLLGRYHM